MSRILLDTGPIVAFLNKKDANHRWACEVFDSIAPPLFTCESVISEACFLVRRLEGGPGVVLELVRRGIVQPDFRLDAEIRAVGRLIGKFADVPMSLADACLVRMAELDGKARVLTLDRDFQIYRKNRRQSIPVLMPSD